MRSSIGLFAAIGLALSLASGAAAGPLRAARTSADVFTGENQDPYVLAVRDYGGQCTLFTECSLRDFHHDQ
jgi:hypothetical protein